MYTAFKLAYDGTCFQGFAEQPESRTVEGCVLNAISRIEGIDREDIRCKIKYRNASRTDNGVSSIGNVISFQTKHDPETMIKALNANLRDIWFYGYRTVNENFNPRHAIERHYRYHLIKNDIDVMKLQEVLKMFEGRHDFSAYSKMDKRCGIRNIKKIVVNEFDDILIIDFFGKSFLRQMIRRIVSAAVAAARGERKIDDLKDYLENPIKTAPFGIAPPEPLILMDVKYSFNFVICKKCMKSTRQFLTSDYIKLKVQSFIRRNIMNHTPNLL